MGVIYVTAGRAARRQITFQTMTDAPIADVRGWARLWPVAKVNADPMPRHGAWYPIVADPGDDRLVIEVSGKRVAVQKKYLEVREDRPARFTVVTRTRDGENPAHGTDSDLGRRYAVCPKCGVRAPLWGEPAAVTCTECGHRGEVAYWETG